MRRPPTDGPPPRPPRSRPIVARVAVACALLLSVAIGPSASAAPQDDYRLGVGYYKKARWDQAAEIFRTFLRDNPQHPDAESAQLYYGLTLVNQKQYAAARDLLRDYVRRYPKSPNLPDALYRVGEAGYSLGDLKGAEADFTAFLTKYPDHELTEYALPYLGDARLRLDRPAPAADAFREALRKFPTGRLADEATFGLARASEALRRPDDAAPLYQSLAAGTGPRAAASQLRVGTLLYDARRYPEAAAAFRDLPARFPDSPLVSSARLNAGFALYRAGRLADALPELRAAAADDTQAATATHWVGMVEKTLGNYDAAAAAFKTVLDRFSDAPIAAESRFQWADAALRAGRDADALRLFEAVADDPNGPHAAEAIHLASEAALSVGDLDKAEVLAERFRAEHPRTAFRMHNRLLTGRVYEARAAAADLPEEQRNGLQRRALAEYTAVAGDTQLEATRDKARFQLARLHERRGEFTEAVAAVAPLIEAVQAGATTPGPAGEPADPAQTDALIIAARSQLALKNPAAAEEAATLYLQAAPTGDQADAALAVRAAARVTVGRSADARADWAQLRDRFPKSDLLTAVARDLAERAYANEDYAAAADFFDSLSGLTDGTAAEPAALSGRAWSLYRGGKFQEAATAFATVASRFPDAATVAPEAAYLRGKALQDAGDLPAATAAYAAAFDRYAPALPAAPGAEADGTPRHAYLAGLQRARVLRLQEKTAEADAAYAALTAKYPRPRNLDDLLDEWALLHYEAEDYPRADVLFRRLLTEVPDSPLAPAASLSLAESSLYAGRLDEAEAALRTLAEGTRGDDTVRQRAAFLRVGLAAERGDWATAQNLATDYLDRFPEGRQRPAVTQQLGEAQLQRGQPDAATVTLERVAATDDPAVRAEPWFPKTFVLLAEAAFQGKDYAAVARHAATVRAFDPPPVYAYTADEVLGRALKNESRFEEARAAFGRVLDDPNARLTETAARAQYETAQTFFLQEQWAAAQEAAFKVYTLYKFPEWQAPALYMTALCDAALGRREQAAAAFADVVREFPDSQYATLAREKLTATPRPGG